MQNFAMKFAICKNSNDKQMKKVNKKCTIIAIKFLQANWQCANFMRTSRNFYKLWPLKNVANLKFAII